MEPYAITSDIEKTIKHVRKTLADEYDVESKGSMWRNYRGLCDKASSMFTDIFNSKCGKSPGYKHSPYARLVHGEMVHSPKCPSKYWAQQHTWVEINISNKKPTYIYVDPTSSQFKSIFDDIPEYYISSFKPRWYLADRDNAIWSNKLVRFIDAHIRIKNKFASTPDHDVYEGIISLCTYEIWGRISDCIRKLMGYK